MAEADLEEQASGAASTQKPAVGRSRRLNLEIGAGITLVLAAIGAAYQIGYSLGEKELAEYKTVNELGLEDTAKNMAAVNKDLLDNLHIFSENKNMKQAVYAANMRIKELSNSSKILERKANEASSRAASSLAELDRIKGDTTRATIGKGDAVSLPSNYVGYISEGLISVNNKKIKIDAGTIISTKVDSKPCRIQVESVKFYETTIVLRCEKSISPR